MSTSPLLEELGRRVRELRRERGMTQHDLADASGVSLRFLGQIESGDGNVSLSRLAEVARGLSVSVVALLGGASPAEEPALALARELLAQRTPA